MSLPHIDTVMKQHVMVGALALSACTVVGPEFEAPTPAGEDAWLVPIAAGLQPAAPVPVRWWETFDDPSLNELVEEARAQNLQVEVAALRVLEARARLGIARGSSYPQTQVAVGDATFVSPSESELLDRLGIGDFWQYSLGASVRWEADFWGRYRRGIEAADASLDASVAAYDQAVVLLTAAVVNTYTAVREAEEQLRISRENEVLQQRSYEITQVLYRNGQESELDMQQALSLLLSTRATIPPLETALQQARNALSSLLGQPPGYVEPILARGEGLPVVPTEVGIGLPADMLRRRPDVRQAELLAMAQNAVVGVATANLYPSFSLFGALGVSSGGPGDTDFADMFGSDAIALQTGGGFVWPFLNYERIKNNIRVEDARLQQALLVYHDTVIQAAREADDAIAGIRGSREEAAIRASAVASAERSSDLSLVRFQDGFSGYQRVLDAQQRLFVQQQRYVANQASLVRDVVALFKSLGGGWEDRSGFPSIDAETLETMRERADWGDLLDNGAQ
jgi:NodT family efflux transporter outer membrane factor (OMF) lipoprotein